MNIRRKLLSCILGCAVLGFGLPTVAQEQKLKFASATLNDVQHQYQMMFKDRVSKELPDVAVELYPASQLGPIPRMVEGVMFGTIESFITATAFLSQVDPGSRHLMSHPFLKIRPRHSNCCHLMYSGKELKTTATLVIFSQSRPLFTVQTRSFQKPIKSLQDLAGLKVRVLGTPFQIEPMKALGATPVPMPLSEVMPALQTGAIDAVIAAPTVAAAFRYYDAAPYMAMVDSWPLIVTVATSSNWLNNLPDETRERLQNIAHEVESEAVNWGLGDVQRAADAWTANGGSLTPLTPDAEESLQAVIASSTAGLIENNTVLSAEVEALNGLLK